MHIAKYDFRLTIAGADGQHHETRTSVMARGFKQAKKKLIEDWTVWGDPKPVSWDLMNISFVEVK